MDLQEPAFKAAVERGRYTNIAHGRSSRSTCLRRPRWNRVCLFIPSTGICIGQYRSLCLFNLSGPCLIDAENVEDIDADYGALLWVWITRTESWIRIQTQCQPYSTGT